MTEYLYQKEDHKLEATKNILYQFKDKVVFNAIIDIIFSELNKIEDLIDNILKGRNIYNATGRQLKLIGKLVGIGNSGLNDDEYRNLIFFQIALNTSKGTPESLINNIKFITNSDFLQYSEGLASINVLVSGFKYIGTFSKRLGEIAPLGVEAQLTYANKGSFGFDNNPLVSGFGDVSNLNDTNAGKWATVAKL